MIEKRFFVYILMSANGMLYIGVTSNLENRVQEHKNGVKSGFASKFQINKLVWFEEAGSAESAILREKQLKKWSRGKKMNLVLESNPELADLAASW
jgi:putative endonuclease